MAKINLTNPAAIPAGKRASIVAVCERQGPTVLGDRYPSVDDGSGNMVPKSGLSTAEAVDVFEQITREFWRQQIEAEEVTAAAEAAAAVARADNAADPFA